MGCGSSKAADTSNSGAKAAGNGATDRDQDKKNAKNDNKAYQEVMTFLGKVNLLKRLPKESLPLLASHMVNKTFKDGEVVIKQGDAGNDFHVIRSGEAKVSIDGNVVATLKTGDYFGETALLREEARTATITAASGKFETLSVTRDKFRELGLHENLTFANRNAVAGGGGKALAKAPSPKTDADKTLISNGLKNNASLSSVVTLDDARINKLMEIAWKEDIQAGTVVIEEGDSNADYFYIVQAGEFEVSIVDETKNEAAASTVGSISPGGSFGELALLYLTPRAATVKATSTATVWVIDRTNFKNVLMQVSDKKVQEYVRLLSGLAALDSCTSEDKEKVAKAMVEMHYSKDEIILQQGEKGSTFYVLYEGQVAIIKDGQQVSNLTVTKGSTPKFFGEKALINEEARGATVKVMSETAKALALDKRTFEMVLSPMKDIIAKRVEEGKGRTRIDRKDLKRIGLLGCGGFGAVELYEHVKSKETYAMKALSKGYIVKTGMQESVMNEKNILMMTNSSFIIKLYETYNGQQSLYFLMEPALGGELYATYNRKGLHGSEKHAKFYVAGTVYAFEHCHERHIIYRDLKPENLLLTDTGMIKLTDMGLAKFVLGKTFTTCGTPDYFAPEIIASTGHTNAVDWWTLGILLFELLSGRPPFESAYPMQTYSKVMKGIGKISFPAKCGPAEPLIKGLLKREPSERLPMRPSGTDNIRKAKWYEGFDWNKMAQGTADAPYKPVVKSKKDIANFSARKEDMPKQLEYKDDGSGWDKDFASQ